MNLNDCWGTHPCFGTRRPWNNSFQKSINGDWPQKLRSLATSRSILFSGHIVETPLFVYNDWFVHMYICIYIYICTCNIDICINSWTFQRVPKRVPLQGVSSPCLAPLRRCGITSDLSIDIHRPKRRPSPPRWDVKDACRAAQVVYKWHILGIDSNTKKNISKWRIITNSLNKQIIKEGVNKHRNC